VRIGLDEAQVWMTLGGAADHGARNIDSEAERRLQRGE